ncbi:MAG: tyrosine-type recombinase/integrase [Firmicutes bacterium]|nr:tyrosine-type recombinase/integrase [Bacillota bacterium]
MLKLRKGVKHMTQSIDNLINYARNVLEEDGLTTDYVKQLLYAWNALNQYLHETGRSLSKETVSCFLKERYGIDPSINFAQLTSVNKRRRRAVHILVNCMEHGLASIPKTYSPYRFDAGFEQDFTAFIEGRKSQDLSLPTINRDIHCLNKLSEYLIMSGAISLQELDSTCIVGFMKWLSVTGQLPTMKGAASSLRLLADYLYHEGIHQQNLSCHVPKVKVKPDGIPSVYTPDEIQTMLEHFSHSNPVDVRNYAMVLLAVRLGMRASDICSLRFENLNWQNSTIEFTVQKTGRHAVLPLTGEVGDAIIEYLRYSRPETDDKHIFIRLQKPYRELRPASLHPIVTLAMRNAGIKIPPGKRHGPHALRASLASEMLSRNTPLPVISETLAHTCTDTTRIYLKIDISHLRKLSLDVPPLGNVWMGGVPV